MTPIGTTWIIPALRKAATAEPHSILCMTGSGKGHRRVLTGELDAGAQRVAARLRLRGFGPGDRLLLVYRDQRDYLFALAGCLAAGVVAVPVTAPDPFSPGTGFATLGAIADVSGATAVLTTAAYDRARRLRAATDLLGEPELRWPGLPCHRTDTLRVATGLTIAHEPASGAEPAVMRFFTDFMGQWRRTAITHGELAGDPRVAFGLLAADHITPATSARRAPVGVMMRRLA
ncbi:AMP-binding enzyme [Amycolatopsis xylanica]|uniref:AMP-binding enzyme n=1 Tax=Amycolatopsis xylanica TaxID=589385 RepID=A0A1H3N4A0_9PSEU|nr:AMP-binding protein [Amycolatopsis xylanica]SDY83628.1 AMP-binding enzyme [Amycolatopsis xylanica]